jgi:hypothetical protein
MPLSQAELDLAAQDAADHAKLADIYREDSELNMMLHTNEKSLTINEKLAGFGSFMKLMTDPTNMRVARVFLFVTALMVVVPLVALFIGMHVVGPALQMDRGTCGGVTALVSVVAVMGGYVVFVLNNEVFNEKKQQSALDASKRSQRPGQQTGATGSPSAVKKVEKPTKKMEKQTKTGSKKD